MSKSRGTNLPTIISDREIKVEFDPELKTKFTNFASHLELSTGDDVSKKFVIKTIHDILNGRSSY